ncbi:MAG: sensor histidine kinase, partial [Pseudomonadota bacterium]
MIWRRQTSHTTIPPGQDPVLPTLPWAIRLFILGGLVAACLAVWIANSLLTDRFVETTRNRAELRQALYAGAILSELQRNSVVPLLLSRDPTLISALNAEDF